MYLEHIPKINFLYDYQEITRTFSMMPGFPGLSIGIMTQGQSGWILME